MDAAGEVLRIEIPLHWTPVRVKGNPFNWHKDLPRTISRRELVTGPKIYRWVLRGSSNETEAVYIGQSEEFRKRLSAYRGASRGGLTPDNSVQAALRQCEDAGGSVELEFLDLDKGSFRINGKLVNNSCLGDHDVRLMMESLAIVAAKAGGFKVLNRLHENVHMKNLKQLLKQYPGLIKQLPDLLKQANAQH